jgi:hypothetical protein
LFASLTRENCRRNKYSYLRSKISGNFVPTRCITIENSVEPQSLQSLPNHNDSFCYQSNSTPNNTIQNDINNLDLSYNDIHVINQNFYYHQNFKEQIEDEFNRTLNEFEHIEPFNRPLLPKQQSSKKFFAMIEILNQFILPKFVNNTTSFRKLHSIIYSGGLTIIRLNGSKEIDQTNNIKAKELPKWERRLNKRINNIRRDLGRITQYLKGINSNHIWYLDDGTLADYPEVVLSDFKKVINLSQEIGLELNFNKCEIFCCSGDTDLKVIKEFQNLAPGIKICDRESLSLLGSPIFDQDFKNTVEKTIITVENLLNKAELLNRHVAYTLIKNCLFIPKFNFLLRTTPFWKFSNYVNSIDSSLKYCLERILNLRLTDLQWRQSTLPIRFGGLGIRRISDICLPAFLSSINGVKKLVSLLLNSKDNELNIHHYDEALAVWGVANENEIPTIPQFQKNWDNINIKGIIANDLIFNSPRDLARFKALQCRESGSWLHAIPSPNIGTLLDNTSFQVCIGLRLGCNLCTPHICKCNAKVDEIGTHGLSCFKSSGRFSRHTEINSIINRSLTSIHVNSTLEPNGLSRNDGKRPDGMTLVPWIKGQPLVWDVTVVDTLADSYVLKSSEVSGFAAEMACKRKHSKYSSIISSNYVFKGLAFETLGPWCKEAVDFINVIGNRLIVESGNSKSKKFLFERISLAIQRGNAASIRGTFPDSAILSEIFVL